VASVFIKASQINQTILHCVLLTVVVIATSCSPLLLVESEFECTDFSGMERASDVIRKQQKINYCNDKMNTITTLPIILAKSRISCKHPLPWQLLFLVLLLRSLTAGYSYSERCSHLQVTSAGCVLRSFCLTPVPSTKILRYITLTTSETSFSSSELINTMVEHNVRNMSHLSTPTHTYGPTCAFYKPTHETSSLTPPAVRAQSFYTSYLSIDDPISPIPPPVGSSTNVSKLPPRPFSAHDSAALEEAWLGLTKKEPKKEPKKERSHHNHGRDKAVRISEPNNTTSDTTHHDKHGQRRHSKDKSSDVPAAEGIKEGSQKKKPKASKKTPWKSTKDHTRGDGEPNKSPTCEQEHSDSAGSALRRRFDHKAAYKKYGPKYKQRKSGSLTLKTQLSDATLHGTSPSEADTTGTPFVRAPSRLDRPRSAMMSDLADENEVDAQADEGDESAEQTSAEQTSPSRPSSRNSSHPSVRGSKSKSRSRSRSRSRNLQYSQKSKDQEATVPVGVFRLHLVRLPMMRLEPIYWSSVHDTSEVIRGTWFFRDSYLPVDSEVAQMLEAGYLELKPWTETWNDELNCAIEVGAEAEAKIIHRLYPNKSPKSADASGPNCDHTTGTSGTCGDERCVERLDLGGGVGPDKLHVGASQPRVNTSYSNASVIYLDSREAYILRPNLVPSPPYRYRRPLASIRKGKTTGIPVVRGFDWQAWEKIHPQKKSATTIRMQEGFNAPQSGTADVDSGVKCEACSKQEEIPTVTDLILVIHG
jgi:hypothetical protein